MGWIRDLLSPSNGDLEKIEPDRSEHFPVDTYGPGFPIVLHQEELNDLSRLLEIEQDAPDGWENSSFLSREDIEDIIDDVTSDIGDGLPSPEERRDEIRDILELWQSQLVDKTGTVWTTLGIDYRLKFYITRCEARINSEYDDFEESEELETARKVLNRIEVAQETDSKLAIVHKRYLPLEEPGEDERIIN